MSFFPVWLNLEPATTKMPVKNSIKKKVKKVISDSFFGRGKFQVLRVVGWCDDDGGWKCWFPNWGYSPQIIFLWKLQNHTLLWIQDFYKTSSFYSVKQGTTTPKKTWKCTPLKRMFIFQTSIWGSILVFEGVIQTRVYPSTSPTVNTDLQQLCHAGTAASRD